MKSKNLVFFLVSLTALIYACKVQMTTTSSSAPSAAPVVITQAEEQASLNLPVETVPAMVPLSPAQSQQAFRVPKGYHMELVASEPMITEPVALAWDGNAKMYVAQMETYTQDTDGTGTKAKISRVMLLEDTDNDGKMDKSSVFIKDLMLPRMLLCVNHELLVNETDTYDIYSYKDTNGDGVADVKKPVYIVGKVAPGNLEHQRSGLVWNLDNYIYQTVDPVRFRYTNGVLKADSLPSGSNGQWGLTHDNYGRLFFSRGGGENAGSGFQINPKYGALEFPDAYSEETFSPVWSSISNPDVQGGPKRLRSDSTLNHFTSANGQSIFRGDRLPSDLAGDYLITEPVARIIRRANVVNREGKTYLENVYQNKEFISSTDFFFRPVNTYTGPDGCVYIIDMNRGIIQESNWTPKGSFLRDQIERYKLDKVNQRGRIWRLVHDGYTRGPQPKMLDVPASNLIPYLDHSNGWWRDNAQKQIVILGDKSVIPVLKQMAKGQQGALPKRPASLGQLHALWTLEGLNAIDKEVIYTAMKDPDPQIRRAAIWIGEMYLKQNDEEFIAKLGELTSDADYDVKTQLILSLGASKNESAKRIVKGILEQHADKQMLVSAKASIDKNEDIKTYGSRLGRLSAGDRKLVMEGSQIYKAMCAVCHGNDGKGLASNIAPALLGAKHLIADKETSIRILLHGLKGPIEGKAYPTEMPAMKDNTDEWIAAVLSYARHEFGANRPREYRGFPYPAVYPADVKKMREQHAVFNEAWTIEGLEKLAPPLPVNR
jgi:glucose/arabinose dehydrogenase/cytochrome c5